MAGFLFLAVADAVNNVPKDSVTQIGVGGIFALLVIREVFGFVKSKKEVTSNGYQKAATCNEIVKRFDMNFAAQDHRFDKVDTQLDEVKTLIKNGSK